jgi:Fe2+ transport system protein FeoA
MNNAPAPKALWDLRPGEAAMVTGFDDGLSVAYQGRVMEFGFQPGARVQCLLNPGFGAPRVYSISNSVFSLDKEIAAAVFVLVSDTAEALS